MKLLHVSSYGDVNRCGIADYTQNLFESLNNYSIEQEFYVLPVSTYTGDKKIFKKIYAEIIEKSKNFDIVHIQHEFGFFRRKSNYFGTLIDFFKFLQNIKSKKVVVTFHTDPLYFNNHIKQKKSKIKNFFYKLKLKYRKNKLLQFCQKMMKNESNRYHFIAHNKLIENSMLSLGFCSESICKISMPIKIIKTKSESLYLDEKLKELKEEKDILIGIIGFIEVYKGILELLDVLEILPENYKLVLCGGQRLGHSQFIETVRARIHNNNSLKERVLITGYLDEGHLHYCFDKVDLFIYPYHDFFASSSAAIGFALQAKKPIITSRVKCFEEIAQVSKCLELVNCQNKYELSAAIQRIIEDRDKNKELVCNIQKFVEENHWDRAGQVFLESYQCAK